MFDKDVPAPINYRTEKKYHFEKMQIGESLFIPVKARNNISSTIQRTQIITGFRYVTRRESDGIRLWRIK